MCFLNFKQRNVLMYIIFYVSILALPVLGGAFVALALVSHSPLGCHKD